MAIVCGTCSDPACVSKHEHRICSQCGTSNAPTNGKRHQTRASERTNVLQCVVCRCYIVPCNSETYVLGRSSTDMAASKGIPPDPKGRQINVDASGPKFCDLCRTHVPLHMWGKHNFTPYHKRQESYAVFKAALDEAERDKHGVVVEGSFDFDIVDPATARNGLTLKLTIKAVIPQSRIALIQIQLESAKQSRFTSSFSVTADGCNTVMVCAKPVVLQVQFQQLRVGRFEDRITCYCWK
ncbi:hypothetical protein BDZ94DRAFT_158082 [Collybia nuda]|uniref:Uncharacterized protein n=1 Tax=Collybia nuda TaxID=64659 RepID=A0A9P5XW79_9AGAR|nr:hypothetical protein BDZ94DRAFT_158082 [Collybia nuda]